MLAQIRLQMVNPQPTPNTTTDPSDCRIWGEYGGHFSEEKERVAKTQQVGKDSMDGKDSTGVKDSTGG